MNTNMENSLIAEGERKGYITFDAERKRVTYAHQHVSRNYSKPEEKVQVEAFVALICLYNYNPERIALFVPVTIGSNTVQADIIVYNDDQHRNAHIVIECKKEDVPEPEFNQAIKQAFSYAATGTVRAKYFWVTSKTKDVYFEIPEKEPKKYLSVPDIPQYGVDKLAKYKYAKGGGAVNGQELFALKKVSEGELTQKFKQAHDALWGGGELNPSEAFDELDKLIFCKIWDEKKARKTGEPYDFQIFQETNENKINEELKKRIIALYEVGRKKDPEVFKDDIRLNAEKLRTVVGYLENIHISNTDLDSKGRAFETFMDSFFRGDFGQYFTPRPIVKFIVDVLPITNESLVLDTSCGSGGFLLYALDKIRKQAAEFFPSQTPIEAVHEGPNHRDYWHDFARDKLFGIEINEQIARTAKMNMIIHDDGHTNVITADGLLPVEDIKDDEGHITQPGIFSLTKNKGFAYNTFDFIITNPPFGSKINQTEKPYLKEYDYAQAENDWLNPNKNQKTRRTQSTEILFIEQCHKFLHEGGYLAIVLPDGILTNTSLQYVRDGIEEKFRIVAVVSMPQTAFQATGAGVKSSVLFLKKHTSAMTELIKERKTALRNGIKEEYDYTNQLQQIKTAKMQHLKNMNGFDNPAGLAGKKLTQSVSYKEWRRDVEYSYKNKINEFKDRLREQYFIKKADILEDYPVFMAIAEDIGYDATGRKTAHNELDVIGKELKRFIATIENGHVMH